MKNESVKKGLSPFSKIMLVLVLVMAAALLILTLLQNNGKTLIYTGAYAYLPIGIVLSLAVWGIYGICGKIRNGTAKKLVGIALGVILVVLFVRVYTVANAFLAYQGSKLAELTNANGNSVFLIRGYYYDEDRYNRRSQDDPGRATEENDLMYAYRAYPVKWKWFMDTSKDSPFVYIAVDSKAKLMQKWNDDGTEIRLYIEGAEEDDRGEITVSFSNE